MQEETVTATARLPGLDIELRHRRLPDQMGEEITLRLRAIPSFEAFGRFLGPTNAFALWSEVIRLAWSPWLEAARFMMAAGSAPTPLPKPSHEPER